MPILTVHPFLNLLKEKDACYDPKTKSQAEEERQLHRALELFENGDPTSLIKCFREQERFIEEEKVTPEQKEKFHRKLYELCRDYGYDFIKEDLSIDEEKYNKNKQRIRDSIKKNTAFVEEYDGLSEDTIAILEQIFGINVHEIRSKKIKSGGNANPISFNVERFEELLKTERELIDFYNDVYTVSLFDNPKIHQISRFILIDDIILNNYFRFVDNDHQFSKKKFEKWVEEVVEDKTKSDNWRSFFREARDIIIRASKISTMRFFISGDLYFHQKLGIEAALRAGPAFIFGDDVGSGKTLMSIVLSLLRGAKNVLIMVPNGTSAENSWTNDFLKKIRPEFYKIYDFTSDIRKPKITGNGKANFVLVNYDKFAGMCWKTTQIQLKDFDFDYIILDEVHHTKSRKTEDGEASQRFRNIKKLSRTIKYKLALSYTPCINEPLEIINLLEFLGIQTFTSLQKNQNSRRNREVCISLFKKLRPYILRRTKNFIFDDYKGHTIDVRRILLSNEEASLYNRSFKKIRKNFNGFIKRWMELKKVTLKYKIPHVLSRIDDIKKTNNSKIVIFTYDIKSGFNTLKRTLIKKCGNKISLVNGYISDKDKKIQIKEFMHGENDIMLCTFRTLSESLSLFNIDAELTNNKIIFADLPFTYASIEQAIGRLERKFQKFCVQVDIFICCSDKERIIDAEQWEFLQSKRGITSMIVDGHQKGEKANKLSFLRGLWGKYQNGKEKEEREKEKLINKELCNYVVSPTINAFNTATKKQLDTISPEDMEVAKESYRRFGKKDAQHKIITKLIKRNFDKNIKIFDVGSANGRLGEIFLKDWDYTGLDMIDWSTDYKSKRFICSDFADFKKLNEYDLFIFCYSIQSMRIKQKYNTKKMESNVVSLRNSLMNIYKNTDKKVWVIFNHDFGRGFRHCMVKKACEGIFTIKEKKTRVKEKKTRVKGNKKLRVTNFLLEKIT